MDDTRLDGFEVPLHTSLTQPILLGGVPRQYAILNGTLAAVIGLALSQIWIAVPAFLLLHTVGVWWTRRDALWLEVLRRHVRERPYYRA
ncbi:MAG: conjugal transfer protein TrbD [Rhodospirillales bacterium]|nr:MAG: conjugal transfer protein TrbD [Rhodospirillales bacterium]